MVQDKQAQKKKEEKKEEAENALFNKRDHTRNLCQGKY